jgi:hypothetical protein
MCGRYYLTANARSLAEAFEAETLSRLDQCNLLFHCPGCDTAHMVRVIGPGPEWGWNESMELPTFTPSLIYCSQDAQARVSLRHRGGHDRIPA